MNRRVSIGLCAAAGLLLAALEPAVARSVSAAAGGVEFGAILNFRDSRYSYSTGAVLVLQDLVTYLASLPTDRSGSKTLTITGRAETELPDHLQSRCRATAWDRFGGSLSVSPTELLPVSSDFESITLDPVVVPSMGAFVLRCYLKEGSELLEFDYSR